MFNQLIDAGHRAAPKRVLLIPVVVGDCKALRLRYDFLTLRANGVGHALTTLSDQLGIAKLSTFDLTCSCHDLERVLP